MVLMKFYLALSTLIVLMIFSYARALAQTAGQIRGVIFQDGTKARIAEVEVRNLRSGQVLLSDRLGLFDLKGLKGDTLQFERTGFLTLKLAVQELGNLSVRLKLSNQLNEVKITAQLASKSFSETSTAYSKEKGIFYDGRPPIWLLNPINGKPLTFFYELLSKNGRRVKRLNQLAKQAAEAEEIAIYFNDRIVRQTVTIDTAELEAYKLLYTPKIDQLKKWSVYQRNSYIKTSFEQFEQSKSKEQLPKF